MYLLNQTIKILEREIKFVNVVLKILGYLIDYILKSYQ